VNETYFFRNIDQFHAFREVAVANRVRARSGERRLRMLSAGCASGEEAYSLAIVLGDCPDLVGWDVAIHGIDVNLAVLEKAARARYTTWALRETPAEIQARCFRSEGRELVLDAALRAKVTFGERNLIEPDPAFWQPRVFDVIFCRNVLMYFTPEIAAAVVARLSRSLAPGGFLFLGYAETLRGLSHDFHLRHTHGTFYYQRRGDTGQPGDDRPAQGAAASESAAVPSTFVAPERLLPGLVAPDNSWVETIRRASERVHALTSSPTPPSRDPANPGVAVTRAGPAPWDLGPAIDLIGQERFAEADALLTALPAASDRDADVLLLKAVLLSHGGDLAAAEQHCAKVLEIDSMSAGAHYLTALCREDAGDRVDAADHDRVAAYLDPAFAMPRLHLGLLARRAGDQIAARRELAEALILLQREDPLRLLLFGGGFGRQALIALCQAQLSSSGAVP
jgi:chemotaxis protein methyltransferase CheR